MRIFSRNKYLLLILIVSSIIIIHRYFAERSSSALCKDVLVKIDQIVSGKKNNATRRILLWDDFFNDGGRRWTTLPFGPKMLRDHLKCPIANCEITNQQTKLRSLSIHDAIVFYSTPDTKNITSLSTQRNVSQFYIYADFEPPMPLKKLNQVQDFFNLTMTYHLDSDIPWPYRQIVDNATGAQVAPSKNPKWRKPPNNWHHPDFVKIYQNKKKDVAWFASPCRTVSQRETLVRKLQKYIKVDTYGRCGINKCDIKHDFCRFHKILQANYKFYLAFESALCEDFITEQVYMAMESYTIPVVFGGANYTRFLPPQSYINAEDFKNVASLARHLDKVGSSSRAYLQYFWWQQFYRVSQLSVFCSLCEFLHNQNIGERVQVYRNLTAWWKTVAGCRKRSKLKFSKKKVKKKRRR